jgi:hypothetical protein
MDCSLNRRYDAPTCDTSPDQAICRAAPAKQRQRPTYPTLTKPARQCRNGVQAAATIEHDSGSETAGVGQHGPRRRALARRRPRRRTVAAPRAKRRGAGLCRIRGGLPCFRESPALPSRCATWNATLRTRPSGRTAPERAIPQVFGSSFNMPRLLPRRDTAPHPCGSHPRQAKRPTISGAPRPRATCKPASGRPAIRPPRSSHL